MKGNSSSKRIGNIMKNVSTTRKRSRSLRSAIPKAVLLFLVALTAPFCVGTASAHDVAAADEPKITVVFDRPLPNVPGKSMRGVLVEYGPGAANRSHRHPNSAFIYATVLAGAIRSQVNDGPEKVYRTGENWFEAPGDHHKVSANASSTEPARLLAVFVVDTGETEIVRPD